MLLMEKISETTLVCAICEKRILRTNLLEHIAEHLSYFRHKCKECNFKTSHNHENVEHQATTGHLVKDVNTFLFHFLFILVTESLSG